MLASSPLSCLCVPLQTGTLSWVYGDTFSRCRLRDVIFCPSCPQTLYCIHHGLQCWRQVVLHPLQWGACCTASESPLVYACELWVFAMRPALRGSTVSYSGVAHFPKHSLEYSLNFWSRSKKIIIKLTAKSERLHLARGFWNHHPAISPKLPFRGNKIGCQISNILGAWVAPILPCKIVKSHPPHTHRGST